MKCVLNNICFDNMYNAIILFFILDKSGLILALKVTILGYLLNPCMSLRNFLRAHNILSLRLVIV